MRSVAFSPDGTRVVSGGNDSLVKVWDVDTSVEVSEQLWERASQSGEVIICIYMYIYICIHIYTYVYIHIDIDIDR